MRIQLERVTLHEQWPQDDKIHFNITLQEFVEVKLIKYERSWSRRKLLINFENEGIRV